MSEKVENKGIAEVLSTQVCVEVFPSKGRLHNLERRDGVFHERREEI